MVVPTVIVGMVSQVFFWVLVEGTFVAQGTEVIRLACVLGFPLSGFSINLHFADGINRFHGVPPLKIRWFKH